MKIARILRAEELTVGQEVYVVSGPYGGKEKVTKITSSGIETECSHFNLQGEGVWRERSEWGERWYIVDEETHNHPWQMLKFPHSCSYPTTKELRETERLREKEKQWDEEQRWWFEREKQRGNL